MESRLKEIYARLAQGQMTRAQALQAIRELGPSALKSQTGTLLADPWWVVSPAPDSSDMPAASKKIVLYCGLGRIDGAGLQEQMPSHECIALQSPSDNLADRYTDYTLACLQVVKSMLGSSSRDRVLLQLAIPNDVRHAVLTGLAAILKTACLERTGLVAQTVLVAPDTGVQLLREILFECAAGVTDDLIKYQHGQRFVRRWIETPEAAPVETSFSTLREQGVYVVTGGLGGVGRLIVEGICAAGARARVFIFGRSAPSESQREWCDSLAHDAGAVRYRQVDVTDPAQMRRSVDDLLRQTGRLDGVFHCAGVVKDGRIVDKETEVCRSVLAPKVTGTVIIDEVTRDLDLDFLVLFSSIASCFGNAGQVDYAAANGFLDGFAEYRNELARTGLRSGLAISINWPLWRDGGIALHETAREMLDRSTGLRPMSKEAGLAALQKILATARSSALVMSGDLKRMRLLLLRGRPLLAGKDLPPPAVGNADHVAGDAEVLTAATERFLVSQLSSVIKLPSAQIDPRAPLERYGIDSIVAMNLTNLLEKSFGALPKTLFFEYQTVRELSAYFVEQHGQQTAALLGKRGSPAQNAGKLPAVKAVTPPAGTQGDRARPVAGSRFLQRVSHATSTRGDAPQRADAVAIIGLSGRYPQASDIERFWDNLKNGRDCITEVPDSRWNWREYYSKDRTRAGGHYSKWGGFIQGAREFDPRFFNISPKEAETIDPQERLFLQHAWAAIEDAGYTRATLQIPCEDDLDGQVGVYAGVMYGEYNLSGSLASIANRVSYVLNLHGPSLTLDTMCSSSLTAIHLACQDLKQRRTSLAIAGGVNLTIDPNKYSMLSAGQFISGTGQCQSFGKGGDGYIPSEGVGVAVLKRLTEAVRDGDQIYGVIRGSGVNHGGKTNGFSVPNLLAQSAAIRRVLAESGTDPRHISYIEAHGTGTRLGDPIEIAALDRAFGRQTKETGFCLVGSAKSNIGHCESAAGIAGLTKVLLQLRHKQIAPSLHSQELNPNIDFDKTAFVVNQALTQWDRPVIDGQRCKRIAGISSFGAGGSNAHLIVEEWVAPEEQTAAASSILPAEATVVPLSARTEGQLREIAENLLRWLDSNGRAEERSRVGLEAIAYTLQVGREPLDERLAMVVSSTGQLAERLQAYLAQRDRHDQWFRARGKDHKAFRALFDGDAGLRNVADRWITDRQLARVCEMWVKGLNFEWAALWAGKTPRRVSLPTYPFAREAYWSREWRSAGSGPSPAWLHPLVHANRSSFGQQRYLSNFGDKPPWLGQRSGTVDPQLFGVVCLEMARAAIADSLSDDAQDYVLELSDTRFGSTDVPQSQQDFTIELNPEDASTLSFEIFAGGKDDGRVVCAGLGCLREAAPSDHVDLSGLKAGLQQTDDQSPTLWHSAGGQVVCEWTSSESGRQHEQVMIEPAALSRVIELAARLVDGTPSAAAPARRLSHLGSARVLASCATATAAWIRPSGTTGGLDIDLCEPDGAVCIELRDVRYRAEALDAPLAQRVTDTSVTGDEPDAVAVVDYGEGVYGLRLNSAVEGNVLTSSVMTGLREGLKQLGTRDDLKAVLLEGSEQGFGRGGRDEVNALIETGVCTALAEFGYPLIGVLAGDALGAGWLLGSLCDVLVCSEAGRYGYTDAGSGLFASEAEETFFEQRFGPRLTQDFLHVTPESGGVDLRTRGWSCAVVPRPQVLTRARELAQTLCGRPGVALSLLKRHLSRDLVESVRALRPVTEPASTALHDAERLAAGPWEVVPGDAGIGELRLTLGDHDAASVTQTLSSLWTQVDDAGQYKVLVWCLDGPTGLPASVSEASLAALHDELMRAPLPLIGALRGTLTGPDWLIAQCCDVCLYDEAGEYAVDTLRWSDALSERLVRALRGPLGRELSAEWVVSGQRDTGAGLRKRVPSLPVTASGSVRTEARTLASRWAAFSAGTLRSWKRRRVQRQTAELPAGSDQTLDRLVEQTSEPFPDAVEVPLSSPVIRATAQANGVLQVTLEDREARNMYSEALVSGIEEVFAHIERTPEYKVVVLTGYDSYFATGGTRESLLAIQEGRAKFTDSKIYHLPLACRLPVIAAMQGHAMGAGWSFGMFADVVLFSEESRYVSPYMSYGFTPGAGATWVFPRKVGLELARESLLSGQSYRGGELAARGLPMRVLERAAVLPEALALADRMARLSRTRLEEFKRHRRGAEVTAVEQVYAQELAMHEQTFVGQDATLIQIHDRFPDHEDPTATTTPAQTHNARSTAPAGQSLIAVKAKLRSLLATELRLDEDEIEDDTQFVDLGLDSIAGVTWIRKINEEYGTSIEATRIYDYPTLTQIAEHVAALVPSPSRPAGGLAANETTELADTPRIPTAIPAPRAAAAEKGKIEFSVKKTQRPTRAATPVPAAPAQEAQDRPSSIAVIGMAGQFPSANSLEDYWHNIATAKDCIREVPPHRWDVERYYRPGDPVAGKANSKWMGLLDEYDHFDPAFFGISPKEAKGMDPQQRLFMQACWQAVESAGYDPYSLATSRCGVMVGCAHSDYQLLSRTHQLSAQGFTGDATSILASRIAYFLNLHGPCVAIDTACSSSLVAIANSCDALASGAIDLALAGGVYVMTGPELHVKSSQAGMLSRDGKCHTFDDKANGFVPGEGVGVVLLKRLADAQRDRDNIVAVVRGWGTNQDGKTNGITAPSSDAQARLHRDVYERFRIDPAGIQLLEAHGTGTRLGDPLEVKGLRASFERYTKAQGYCALGSVKSNIGHCLTAAGVAGFIKLCLALQRKKLPPTINFERLNEHIDLDKSPFFINDTLQDWTVGQGQKRCAAINSFGFSGTNAHVVVEEHQTQEREAVSVATSIRGGGFIVPLAARDPASLRLKAADLLHFLEAREPTPSIGDVAYTLQVGRAAMVERLGFVVASLDELVLKLRRYMKGEKSIEGCVQGRRADGENALAPLLHEPEVTGSLIGHWAAAGNGEKILALWAGGVDLDWQALYDESRPRRINLPVYRFAKERYWIDGTAGDAVPREGSRAGLHALLQANESDLSQVCYRSVFSGAEIFFERRRDPEADVLTSGAYIEMLRAAGAKAASAADASGPVVIDNLVFGEAFVADGSTALTVFVDSIDRQTLGFEVSSETAGEQRIHCQGEGRVATGESLSAPAFAGVDGRAWTERLEGTALRERLTLAGIDGSTNSPVVSLRCADDELLAELAVSGDAGSAAYGVHPLLFDGALNVARVLMGATAPAQRPVSVRRVSIAAPGNERMRVSARRVRPDGAAFEVDIDLVTTEGELCARLRGVSYDAVATQTAAVAEPVSIEPVSIEPVSIEPVSIEPVQPSREQATVTRHGAPPGKPRGIPLAPLLAREVARPLLAKPNAIRLRDVRESAASQGEQTGAVAVVAYGEGVYGLRLNSAVEGNGLTPSVMTGLRDGLKQLGTRDDLKAVLLEGTGQGFGRGGRDEVNALIETGVCTALAEFGYPLIGVLAGDALGAGWLLGALCDVLVCSEAGRYGYTDAGSGLFASEAEETFFEQRFGPRLTQDLLHVTPESGGADLLARGWSCAVVPRPQVLTRARELAQTLCGRPGVALSLLKRHLSRDLVESVRALRPVTEPASTALHDAERLAAGPWEVVPGDAGIGELRLTPGDHDAASVTQTLSSLWTQLDDAGQYKVLVWCLDGPTGLPASVSEASLAALHDELMRAPLPLIGALRGTLTGPDWLIAQCCDVCLYDEAGEYAVDTLRWSDALSERLVRALRGPLGRELSAEWVVSGQRDTGAGLRERVPSLPVTASVLAEARTMASRWTAFSAGTLRSWKRRRVQRQTAELPAGSDQTLDRLVEQTSEPFPDAVEVPLTSPVIRATAQANGVLQVTLEDREARNMYSEALVSGIEEVFAHIERTPEYKVVVLTGYDSYFATGGTRESLLAIQEGRAKFTDSRIYHLPLACRLPVIAAMQGHAMGAGWSFGMFADVVLFSEESRYVSPYMSYGFTPGAGATWVFPRKVGLELARESLLSGQSYRGGELAARGLPMRVLERAAVLPEALALADRMARLSRTRLEEFKRHRRGAEVTAVEQVYAQELAMHEQTFVGQDATLIQIHDRFLNQDTAGPAPRESAVNGSGQSRTVRGDEPKSARGLAEVTATLRRLLAEELEMDEARIATDSQFVDLGVDSIIGVSWVNGINESFDTALDATKIYRYPTLMELGRHVQETAPQPAPPAAEQTQPPARSERSDQGNAARVVAGALQHVNGAGASTPGSAPPPPARLSSRRRNRWSRAADAPGSTTTEIAIIGMAGQFPLADNVDAYWENLAEGRHCIREVPRERWDAERYYLPGDAVPGKTNSKWMGDLPGYDLFDPLFFNISPAEAEYMDPQQRLFLQACWHSIEHAGYDPKSLSGSQCGVFVGCGAGDYHRFPQDLGSSISILAARISYFLNLQGPCLSIDTACSSSLVAIASACDNLVSGSADLALAGGVCVLSTPSMHIMTSQANMLSADGKCFSFDQKANGFVPGEAVGVVVLKRLADAHADGDRVLGVIRGWGVNQDGKTNGITAPNPESQSRLQREIYQRHRIDPGGIQLIEAHGTGTKLGDPIEVEGLREAFADYTKETGYCALGSVKSNIGHCLFAAGIAGVIKVLLALRHRQLPPTINFERLNEHIRLDDSPFYINDRLRDWTVPDGGVRQAAISSFGFSGTNAHLVIGEDRQEKRPARAVESIAGDGQMAVLLSARTATALTRKVRDLLAFIERPVRPPDFIDLAYTLQIGREAMEERLGLMARSVEELGQRLRAWLDDELADGQCYRGLAEGHDTLQLSQVSDSAVQTGIDECLRSGDVRRLLELWVQGTHIDWRRLYGEPPPRRIELPLYPFDTERYWMSGSSPLPADRAAAEVPVDFASIERIVERIDEDAIETAEAVALLTRALA